MSHPNEILQRLRAAPLKGLSQNFLTSPHWAEKLVTAVLSDEAQAYFEIGPGLGALTRLLSRRTDKPVLTFEFDRKLAAYLGSELKDSHTQIIQGDFLDVYLPDYFPEGKVGVLSNLPYHLSSPILFKLIPFRQRFTRLILTFQKEFAARLTASPRTSAYGSLSVASQLAFEIQSLGTIPPGAFYPQPDVASEVLCLLPKENADLDPLQLLVRQAFSHRRKKLTSNLRDFASSETLNQFLLSHALTLSARPEELTPGNYLELSRLLPILEVNKT